jgi:hypothetical protein
MMHEWMSTSNGRRILAPKEFGSKSGDHRALATRIQGKHRSDGRLPIADFQLPIEPTSDEFFNRQSEIGN